MREETVVLRDVEATAIPYGDKLTLSAGSPVMRAAWRAFRIAFSTKVRPVSSASDAPRSVWAYSTWPASPSSSCNSASLPALLLARTSFMAAFRYAVR